MSDTVPERTSAKTEPVANGAPQRGLFNKKTNLERRQIMRRVKRGVKIQFSAAEVSIATGASLRQLQWWDERKVIEPVWGIVGHSRLYSPRQVEDVRRLMILRRAGVSLRRARPLISEPWQTIRRLKGPTVVGDVLMVP